MTDPLLIQRPWPVWYRTVQPSPTHLSRPFLLFFSFLPPLMSSLVSLAFLAVVLSFSLARGVDVVKLSVALKAWGCRAGNQSYGVLYQGCMDNIKLPAKWFWNYHFKVHKVASNNEFVDNKVTEKVQNQRFAKRYRLHTCIVTQLRWINTFCIPGTTDDQCGCGSFKMWGNTPDLGCLKKKQVKQCILAQRHLHQHTSGKQFGSLVWA